jgi:hypothetical protein
MHLLHPDRLAWQRERLAQERAVLAHVFQLIADVVAEIERLVLVLAHAAGARSGKRVDIFWRRPEDGRGIEFSHCALVIPAETEIEISLSALRAIVEILN